MLAQSETLATPRIYLDIDGVLLADSPEFPVTREFDLTRVAPEALARLDALPAEVVWLSTWTAREINWIPEELGLLTGKRNLERPRRPRHPGVPSHWKLLALIHDQSESPSPFIWIDDQITLQDSLQIGAELKTPHLIINPHKETGIVPGHLTYFIEPFVRRNQPRRKA